MKTMTSCEAKMRFGKFLDTMQREPVIVTKNNRPVGIMLSIEDAKDTLVTEMFLQKEDGYDEWFNSKIKRTLDGLKNGSVTLSKHDDVMNRLWNLI